VSRGISLAGLLEQSFSLGTGWHFFSLLPHAFRPRDKPIFESFGLFETTPQLHGVLLSIPEEGGSATGVLITDMSHVQGCDA
jgi:hypothetical protein